MIQKLLVIAAACAVFLTGCGSAREKSAPCKRPGPLAYAPDPRSDCGAMHRLNDPMAAFDAIGIVDPARKDSR
ncbi:MULTISPECIES: hypothetical protein [unclassified Rhizobium]|uniref:hypothetical protein n=1 Tax=unclassified Rhizobium TaxID=2613769 RepID=UPI00161AF524|nr:MULTISPECIES: hypothetical protein [unclassified Rhizobium]MBB3320102.1 hypothetical protein [Rhizobium sp. BK181]MCS3744055.1 hypothetical protein [Rhizobium sp. BK661]